ncbi:hypothetical protein FIBSPDRAFT_841305 [Athelia psychrophila]|uniref:PRISE-like Rossmann-fold domain-containing protein n=1 Tax=Athelia psychrophila TaxID=1759441 RepID=A0A167XMF6_9AGAM|nr:hypothetical protein FIBSPDRAFT_841305 [Fibularhizoctonia sp. CBS 109695]
MEALAFIRRQLFTYLPVPTKSYAGKIDIVTGSNVDLDKEAAEHYARLGAETVIVAVYSLEKGEAARSAIIKKKDSTASLAARSLLFPERPTKLPRIDVLLKNVAITTSNLKLVKGYESTITTKPAYIHSPGQGKTLVDVNAQLVDSAVLALKALSPRLEHITLQTGGKVYGIEHFPKVPIPPTPWKESLPRVQDPSIASQIFYYRQVDILAAHARGSSWKWTEIRPDAIVGFAPTSTAMNIALPLGVFLALWRAVHGSGATIPFPGPRAAYERTHTETPMGATARFQIFASLRGGETHAQAYNIGTPPSSYAHKWPLLAGQFGLVGAPPAADEGIDVAAWVSAHRVEWEVLEKEHGLKAGVVEKVGWDFLVILTIPVDREYDTSKARELGFREEMDLMAAYKEAWGLMAASKLLPPA